jgi:hypothetical protein
MKFVPFSVSKRIDRLQNKVKTVWKRCQKYLGVTGVMGLTLSILFSGLLFILIQFFPVPSPVIDIEAESEYLEYRVLKPDLATIPIENSTYRGDNSLPCAALEGGVIKLALLEPSYKSLVKYNYGGQRLAITLISNPEHPSKISFPGGNEYELTGISWFVLQKPKNDQLSAIPLPIVGPGQIGKEIGRKTLPGEQYVNDARRPLDLLLGGTLRIYGRTVFPLNKSENRILYPSKIEKFVLPVGARLTSGGDINNIKDFDKNSWHGAAMLGERAMNIWIRTESDDLKLFRPGSQSDSERYKISIFTKLFEDPSVAPYSIFFLSFAISMQVICGWISIWNHKEQR